MCCCKWNERVNLRNGGALRRKEWTYCDLQYEFASIFFGFQGTEDGWKVI